MIANGIKQTTTTTGTGDLTLSAVSKFPAFSDHFALNQPFFYTISRQSDGSMVEIGVGKLTASNTLNRAQVLQTYDSAFANDNPAAVTLAAGTYDVSCGIPQQAGAVSSFPGVHSSASLRAAIAFSYQASANTKALTPDTPIVAAIRVEAGKGIAALGVGVTGASGTSSNKIRIGLYAINLDGSPGVKVAESGNMLPNTTGNKSASLVGGKKHLPPGWYYAAVLSDVGVTLVAGSTSAIAQVTPLGMNSSSAPNSGAFATAIGSGWSAMPSSLSGFSMIGIGSDFVPLPFIYYD